MENLQKHIKKTGLVIVISGPSGVGKDTTLNALQEICPFKWQVTATTREPRNKEKNGIDYHFLSKEEFERRIIDKRFLEYAKVFDNGNYYGTPIEGIKEAIETGEDIVLKLDIQGGGSVKKEMPDAVLIFLVPPTFKELERRLSYRKTETPEEYEMRIKQAHKELESVVDYDYVVINDDVRTTAEDIRAIIIAEKSKVQK